MRRIHPVSWTRRNVTSRVMGYVVAVIATGADWLLQWHFDGSPEDTGLLMSLFFAVGLAGWVGGFGPAICAAALSLFLVVPDRMVSWHHVLTHTPLLTRVVVFSVLCVLAALVLELTFRQRRAMRRHFETVEAFNRLAADFSYEWQATERGALKLTDITEGVERLTGYTVAELKAPGGWDKLLPPDDSSRSSAVKAELLQGKVSTGHQRLITRDGRTVWIEYRSEPLLDRAGRMQRIIGAAKEITAQKEAEEKLRRQMALLDAVNSSATDAIFLKDHEGRYIYVNRAFWEWAALDASQLLGKTDLEVMRDRAFAEREEAADQRVMATGLPEVVEETCRFGSLTTVFQTTKAPWRDAHGRIVGVAGVARDITVHRALEEHVAQADRRKEEFIAVLAHELRNPLAPLVNGIRLLSAPGIAPALAERTLTSMSRQISILTRLVDDMLDVAHINRGKMDFVFRTEDLDAIVAAAVDATESQVGGRGQTIAWQRATGGISVRADRVRLTQAITNLITNASKFSPEGGVIGVRCWLSGQRASVSVSDQGPGVPPAERDKIFELFNRGTDDRKEGGLGIGLALVRHIARAHGAVVSVDAGEGGKGAKFTVELDAVASVPHNERTQAVCAPNATCAARRILVVDDNRDAADSLALVLQSAGHDTFVVYDGSSALALLGDQPVDVAILDLGMPGMDGLELAARIRQCAGGAQPVLIALSGWAREEDHARSRAAGFALHFAKPVAIDALLAAVSSANLAPGGATAP